MKSPRVGSSAVVSIKSSVAGGALPQGVKRALAKPATGDTFVFPEVARSAREQTSSNTLSFRLFGWTPVDSGRQLLVEELGRAFGQLGLQLTTEHLNRVLALEEPVPDTAVEALRRRVLSDTALSSEVATALRHYSAEALAKGTKTADDRLLRLELLLLAAPDAVRPALLEAVRMDLDRQSDAVKRFLSTPGQGLDGQGQPRAFVPNVTIGGGPQGQTIANQLHEEGKGKGNLIIDSSRVGDGNFGSVRSHPANSRTRAGYLGDTAEAVTDPSRTQHPLHGSPVQVEDLSEAPHPQAGDIGDAASLGLYAAFSRGTEVLTETKVLSVEKQKPGGARYLLHLQDTNGKQYRLFTDQVVVATGMGAPKLLIKDPATRAYIARETEQLKAKGGSMLPTQAVAHSEDFLRASNTATDDELLDFVRRGDGPLMVVGFGDAAKTPLLRLLEVATRRGTTLEALLGDRKILWLGIDDEAELDRGLRGPYKPLRALVDAGKVEPLKARLERLAPTGESLTHDAELSLPDGTKQTRQTGRVLLAMGMAVDLPTIIPFGMPGEATYQPVVGSDPAYGDVTPLATQVVLNGASESIYVAGVASGLEKPKDVSFLDYFGWKTTLLSEQVLASGIKTNANPFEALRMKFETVGTLRGAPSSSAVVELSRFGPRELETPQSAMLAQTGLFGVLSRFEFPDAETVTLTFSAGANGLELEVLGVDEDGATQLAKALDEHPSLVGLFDRMATDAPVSFTARISNHRVAEVK